MSIKHYITISASMYNHLTITERQCIERWLKDGIKVAEIAYRLGRNRSTIYREIQRGSVKQIKQKYGYHRELYIYFSDYADRVYHNNRKKSGVKKIITFSTKFFSELYAAFQKGLFKGKEREYSIRTFTECYKKANPADKVPTHKTLYSYIRQQLLIIKPHDLPVMYRLLPRKNKNSKPKGTNKRVLGLSIAKRPDDIMLRNTFGHWEADLVKGKKTSNEPAIITLVERKTRFAFTVKIPDYKSQTVYNALLNLIYLNPEIFKSMTFDNGAEFTKAHELPINIYYCHAYSSWERGSNENFNKLLREFIPKGISLHKITEEYLDHATKCINNRIREVIGFRTSKEYFETFT